MTPSRQVSDSVDPRSGQHYVTPTPSMGVSTTETVVCRVSDMNDGEMREFQIGERTALLVKDKGQYYAMGNRCTHYGAPLSKGVYCQGRVRCPWHGACFNVTTGDIEDFPGLDSLPVFQVEIREEDVIVKADPEVLESNKRVKVMSRSDPSNPNTFVLVGGGAASITCAQTLREEGFSGRVVVVTQEQCLPYDRPKLSKALSSTAESLALRNQDFFRAFDIEVMTGVQVTGVDTEQRQVQTACGQTLTYQALLLATGGRPRKVSSIPGGDLQNVCVLRTPKDANRIAELCPHKHVVILGTSFIGLEVAAYAQSKAASSVSVVGRSQVALQHVFGEEIGACITKLHESKGVKFYFQNGIREFVGEDGKLKQAILNDGTVLEADLCVLGVGVEPVTDFLENSDIELTSAGYIPVNKCMQTQVEGVYAGGDIVQFPLFLQDDRLCNVQHWQMAHQHGRIAALNMLEKQVEIRSVPYFWTVMYGKSLRYAGYGVGYDDVVLHGDSEVPQFVAFFTKGERVVAVASLAFDPIVSQVATLMEQGHTLMKTDVLEDPTAWTSRLKDL